MGGRASRARSSPDGAPPLPPPQPAATAAATASRKTRLTQRLTCAFVEEVDLRDVDRDRDVVRDPQLDVRWELGDEIRARADDASFVVGRRGERLVDDDGIAPDRAVVDLEVGHRLGAERLDELHPR